jgi:Lanthionine synthetase C-like protein
VLYRPESFESLGDERWDEGRARSVIAAIVAATDEAYDPQTLWPANEWDAWMSTPPLKDLYGGAGGVVWALDALRRRGFAETRVDLAAAIERTLELWEEEPDLSKLDWLPEPRQPGLLGGEGGLLMVAYRVAPSSELADRLFARVRENVDHQSQELMWGSPGTMLAALALYGWTADQRWLEAWQESADALLARRDADGLWTQRIQQDRENRYLGPVHGLLGNVHALRAGGDETTAPAAARVLACEAVVEDGLANWPARAGGDLVARDGEIRLQWCHGSPGVVATATSYLDEELLLAGAGLVWRAGAHREEKGVGLCHGTAGNGFALLKAFARTGDERWLERARRFAMHALGQVERGPGRYSLFTGDLGVALFVAACVDADPRFPILDAWD